MTSAYTLLLRRLESVIHHTTVFAVYNICAGCITAFTDIYIYRPLFARLIEIPVKPSIAGTKTRPNMVASRIAPTGLVVEIK